MHDYLYRFSYQVTPRSTAQQVKDEEDTSAEISRIKDELKNKEVTLTFADITADIQLLSEAKRNSLSADQLFCLYLRDCSQLVCTEYYR